MDKNIKRDIGGFIAQMNPILRRLNDLLYKNFDKVDQISYFKFKGIPVLSISGNFDNETKKAITEMNDFLALNPKAFCGVSVYQSKKDYETQIISFGLDSSYLSK